MTTLAARTVISGAGATPASGSAVEIVYGAIADTGAIFAYNRTGGAYRALQIEGLTVAINSISGGATTIGGTLGVTGQITGNLTGTATSLAGGAGGQIPYQSAAGTTAMLANGTAGQVLTSQGTTLAPVWSSSSGTTQWTTTGSNIYYNTGYVGIGTATQATKLHVSGAGTTAAFYTDNDAVGQTLYLQATGGASGDGGQILFGAFQGIFAGIKGYIVDGTGPAGDLIFQTRTTSGNVLERMRINSGGSVLVNTTSALDSYSKLHVSGQVRASNLPATPQMYGAAANGSTDDSAAVQSCVTTANCYFPPGTYLIKTQMMIPSSAVVYGAGPASVIKMDNTFVGTAMSWAGTEKYGFVNSNIATAGANSNIEVHSLKFLATSTTNAGYHLIHFHNTSSWSVHNNYFDGAAGAGDAVAGTAVSDFQITNNHAVDFTNCVYDVWEGSSNGLISNNFGRTSAGGAGIFVNGMTTLNGVAHTVNVAVTGNVIEAGGGAANGQGIYIAGLPGGSTTKYSTVTGNVVRSNGSNTFAVGIDVREGGYNAVSGNTIIGAHTYGLFITTDYNTIVGNVVPTATTGLSVGGDNNTISGNIVSNTTNTGTGNAINRADYLADFNAPADHGYGFTGGATSIGSSASTLGALPTGTGASTNGWVNVIIDASDYWIPVWAK